jgi:hypothetical protein
MGTSYHRPILVIALALAVEIFAVAASDPAQNVQAAGTVLLALYRSSPAAVRKLFVENVDAEFFPLQRGTTFFYQGTKDGVPTRTETHVTDRTAKILNVDCTVVRDRDFENDVLIEDTLDYYAQDVSGNVWYFGEDSKELDGKGHVISTEGSWRAGVNGAAPGLIMEAHPKAGDRYYQEMAAGVAEDMATVRSVRSSTCVPYDCFDDLLRTRETSRFEPDVVEQKYYAKHIGFVRGDTIAGENEHTALVRITHEKE